MKRQILKIATVGTVAAGMIFAQAPAQSSQSQSDQAQAGQAQTRDRHDRRGPDALHRRAAALQRIMQELNLTEAQKQQAKTIFGRAREAAKPVREQLRQNREALAAAVKSDNTAQIRQLGAERGKLLGQLATARTEATAKFYKELTPAQREKAERIHQRMQARMHRRAALRTNG
jgi:Spy/CpxP family protein refolding chaperone